ncbi:GL15037 [Drosophila persimilis]|uniref:GL15037 n=1 Tax=Drosophila persimilis TaxID=7234 RepID=B4HB07_DROPE|nr:GL15037 [Drosophila persimilis]
MAKWLLGLWLLLLVVNGHEANAYHSGGYRTSGSNQAEQAGLSAGHSAYGSSGNIQEQSIYERPSEGGVGGGACPPQFSGVVSYPYDCHRYVNCHNGSPTIQTCAPGTLFNARTLVCDHPSNVACATPAGGAQAAEPNRSARLREVDTEPRCTPGVIGLQPHPTDCTKFLNCANGKVFVQDCGPGTAFSPSALVCVHKSTVDCGAEAAGQGFSQVSSEVPRCPPGLRGLHQHHRDPYKYLVCGIGVQARVEKCPPGQNFDAHRLVCVFSASSSSQSSSDPSTAVETNPSGLLCPAGVDGLFVHPFDQTKFLNCKAGKVAVQSCQPGYVFSISRGYCQLKSQLVYSDYVTYITSEISYEYSMILSACPGGTDGLHLYPYDAGKYVRCSASKMTILACEQQMAFSLSQKACRPRSQLNSEDRVKFLEELQVQTTYSYQDSQTLQSPLRSCPRNLQGNYPYPFHAGHFVKCQNGLLQVEGCPSGFVFSLSQRECAARHLLSTHDFLDYVYLSGQFLTDFMQDLTMITCPPRSQGYYLHPFDCTKYVICWDQQTAIESCKQGEVFSISQQICVARDKVTASYDRVEYLGETQHELSEEAESEQPLPGRGFPHDGGYQPQHSGLPLDGRYQPQRYVPGFGGGNQPSLGSIIPQAAGYPPQAQPTGPAFDGGYQQSQGRGFPQEGGYQPAPAALMCPPRVTGLFPNPFDAMGYLHCMEGHTLTRRCSTTDVFSISRGFCVPNQQVASGDRIPYNQQRSVEEDACE